MAAELNCLKIWEQELEVAVNKLTEAEAATNLAKKVCDNTAAWKNKIEGYWNSIKETHHISKDIKEELLLFDNHIERICVNVKCTMDAMELLLCDVSHVFEHSDELKAQIDDLLNRIKSLGDPSINEKTSSVVKCLTELSAKLDEVVKIRTETLSKTVDALLFSTLIYENICNDSNGLKAVINDMLITFGGEGEMACKTTPEEEKLPDNSGDIVFCSDKICPSEALFPLDNDPYYEATANQFTKAEKMYNESKENYDTQRKNRDNWLSKKTSLEDALQAANEAKSCK